MPDDSSAAHGIAEPTDVLDPRHYVEVRRQGPSLRTLPLWCYTSPRFFEAEMERVFRPSWNLLERLDLVPNPGDFHALSFMNIPLLVVRGRDGPRFSGPGDVDLRVSRMRHDGRRRRSRHASRLTRPR